MTAQPACRPARQERSTPGQNLSCLKRLTWCQIAEHSSEQILVLPIGSTEQHGPHLPCSTDTEIAGWLAASLAARRPDVLVGPALPYGASGEHADFPGTISIGTTALEAVLVELARSSDAFAGVVFVSAHGGNREALDRAASVLHREGRNVRCWSPNSHLLAVSPSPVQPLEVATAQLWLRADLSPGRSDQPLGDQPLGDTEADASAGLRRDAHAGFTETSIMLAIDPAAVRTTKATAGETRPLAEVWPALKEGGVRAVSANGVLGDPAGASAEHGRQMLDALSQDLFDSLKNWPVASQETR